LSLLLCRTLVKLFFTLFQLRDIEQFYQTEITEMPLNVADLI